MRGELALNHILVLGLILHAHRQTDTQTDRRYILTPVDEVAECVQVFIALQDVWSTCSSMATNSQPLLPPLYMEWYPQNLGVGGAEWEVGGAEWEGLHGGRC